MVTGAKTDLAGTWEGAEATETPETPAPATEAEATPDDTNVEPADLSTEIARLRKENNDLRSQQGQRNARQRDLLLQENADRMGAIEKVLDRLASRIVKGDEDTGFETDLETIRETRQKTAVERRWDAKYEELKEALNEAIYDDDGNVVLTPQSPELASAREQWNAAVKDRNEEGAQTAIRMAYKARIAAERNRVKEKPEPPKPKGPDMTVTNGSSASVAVTEQNIDNLVAHIRDYSPAKQAEIRAKYRNLMQTGSF